MAFAKNGPAAWFRPQIQYLEPYELGRPVDATKFAKLKLNCNENAYGCSAQVMAAFDLAAAALHIYPDALEPRLRRALAELHGLEPRNVLVTAGSSEAISLLARGLLGPGDEYVVSQYGYFAFDYHATALGAHARQVDCRSPGDPAQPLGHDVSSLLQGIGPRTRAVFVANPNNPTGTWLDAEEMESLVVGMPRDVLLVVDEAYAEYAQARGVKSALELARGRKNVLVTRTFSKVYGLAGLRVGYALGDPELLNLLHGLRDPSSVNVVAQEAALLALQDQDFVERSVATCSSALEALRNGLSELGCRVHPSVGNFVLVHVECDADDLIRRLDERGVMVRRLHRYGLSEFVRISAPRAEHVERVLAAWRSCLAERSANPAGAAHLSERTEVA